MSSLELVWTFEGMTTITAIHTETLRGIGNEKVILGHMIAAMISCLRHVHSTIFQMNKCSVSILQAILIVAIVLHERL
jgi:hypothetical protein